MPKPMSYREFEQFFDRIYKEKRAKRRQATGTLEPGRLKDYIESGRPLPPEYGTRPDGTPFTRKDLKAFDKRRQEIAKRYGAKRGVPLSDVWAKTLPIDRQRAQREIRNATLYRIETSDGGNATLNFQVTASPQSKYRYHRSRIRLEDWTGKMMAMKNPRTAVIEAVNGRLSFECDCGRFQYWFRYLVGAMGAGIKPLEKAYPKIRNPRLTGVICKHLVTALANLQSPAVQRLLATEMRKQRDAVGFGDETDRFVDEGETGRRAAASMRASRADVKAAYKNYMRRRSAVAKQRKKEAEKMEREALKRMTRETARKEKAKRDAEKADRDAKATALRAFLDAMKPAGLSAGQLRTGFAASQGMSEADVSKLAADYKVELG